MLARLVATAYVLAALTAWAYLAAFVVSRCSA